MNDSLFAPSPRRKRGLILTLAGSLLFHGSLIGIAALWPMHPSVGKPNITEVGLVDPQLLGEPLTPPPEAAPPSQPELLQPELKVLEPVDNPPPTAEPNADDMSLATPAPPASAQTPFHQTSVSPATHTARTHSSLAVSGSAGGANSNPDPGQAGSTMRWKTPEPPYPAALRMARAHGNGVVRVTTDSSGRVVSAAIVQSTGNPLLDDNTCRAARNDWSGPPNSTVAVPITYRLQ